MVYVDPDDLKWMPYVKTWMLSMGKRIPGEAQEILMNLFGTYVEDGLLFVSKKCKQAIRQVTECIFVKTFEKTLTTTVNTWWIPLTAVFRGIIMAKAQFIIDLEKMDVKQTTLDKQKFCCK
ncbi:dynein, axonemal, heavy chain 6 [Plakobranchus ocellatus]|uniref:Dynein, axonemal, heavy chain 6 n=1 Tax=Plakobranchus ocellatus TaxID=259542 RepID=A0AAV4DWY7_9GAST|nr:dynein, axonemal, heavy chain 6 [Plakobranchus ocellatus]